MKSSVFAPSHITGFFEIIDHVDPLKKGSRGAGVVLDKGVLTKVIVEEGSEKVDIKINGKSQPKIDPITNKTIDLIKNRFQLADKKINLNHEFADNKFNHEFADKKIIISHEFELPIGTGFGISAGCALGASFGLTKALNLPLTYNEAGYVAHLAEIEMKSGLGDVIAEMTGGLVLRLKEGSPGFGRTDRIIQKDIYNNETCNELYVITKTLGEIETSKIIDDPLWKSKINKAGKNMLGNLLKMPDLKTFLKLSREFAEETSLMSDELLEVIIILDDETIGASMAMLGNTAFALSKTPDTSVEGAIISKIDYEGCRFI